MAQVPRGGWMGDYLKILEEDRRRSIRRVEALASELDLQLSSLDTDRPLETNSGASHLTATQVAPGESPVASRPAVVALADDLDSHARAMAAFLRRTGSASRSPPRPPNEGLQTAAADQSPDLAEAALRVEAALRYEGRQQDIVVVNTDSPAPLTASQGPPAVIPQLSLGSASKAPGNDWTPSKDEWRPIAPWASPVGQLHCHVKQPKPTRTFHPTPTPTSLFSDTLAKEPSAPQLSIVSEPAPPRREDEDTLLSPRSREAAAASSGRKKSVSFAPVPPTSS